MGSENTEEIPVSKKSIAFVILGIAALFIVMRMVAPTLTAIVGTSS